MPPATLSFGPAKATAAAGYEPRSVLDRRRSSSPPTSSSTLSSSLDAAAVAGGAELQPIPPGLDMAAVLEAERCGPAMAGDWDGLFSEPSAVQDQAFLRWVMADPPEPFALGLKPQAPIQVFSPLPLELFDPVYGFEPGEASFHIPPPSFVGQEINPSSAGLLQNHLPVAPAKPPPPPPQAAVDLLFEAAELIDSGDFVIAREILARLNHQLSPAGKPVIRSAFYCKEALESIMSAPTPPPSSPLETLLKLSAYKAFSDLSPLLHFANLTAVQAVLDQTNGCDRIHVIDFDLALGLQWSSLLQELSRRRRPLSVVPSLKLTAFAPLSSHHSFELGLVRETLTHFARDLNVQFEFNVLAVESFDPAELLAASRGQALAVNLPASSGPGLARFVKQLSPKVVVCVDHGWDHSDFSFSRHVLLVLQSAAVLLDSIDAAAGPPETVGKIERYLVRPRIQTSIVGRRSAAEKAAAPPWKVFAAAGLVPVKLSNSAEVQAECLVSRSRVRGFRVERRQSSLVLCWQAGGLASVSAWSC